MFLKLTLWGYGLQSPLNTTFSTGLVGVENVVLTTKGLQERNTSVRWDDGGK